MGRLLIAAALLLLPFAASAQEADSTEAGAVTRIAQCLVQGLPADWAFAHMLVELPAAGAATGGASYMYARGDAEDELIPFTPCDRARPARILVQLRDLQPAERQGWVAARLVFDRDGNFRLSYDYPK